jgi:hypothetical protein
MIMGSIEYIDDISKASTALVIFAYEPAARGPHRVSLSFIMELSWQSLISCKCKAM